MPIHAWPDLEAMLGMRHSLLESRINFLSWRVAIFQMMVAALPPAPSP
jgi:hypothetical protein